MRLTSLPEALRAAGLTVREVAGWRTRGSESWGPIRGITCHHTAGSRNSTDAGEISVLLNGSESAPPPIAQLYLSRSGEWHVVASGRCNHNLTGWGGPNAGYGNSNLVGIEAQHSGGTEPWTDAQYDSYVRGVAALCKHLGVPPTRVAGHKEHQPGAKTDPTFNMDNFRARVVAVASGEDTEDMPTVDEIWARKFAEYVDENGNRVRDQRTVADILFATHGNTITALIEQRAATAAILQAIAAPGDLTAIQDAIQAATQDAATALAQHIDATAAVEAARDAELRALVQAGESGELDAAEVIRLMGQKLTA